jgi:hypothetical protein
MEKYTLLCANPSNNATNVLNKFISSEYKDQDISSLDNESVIDLFKIVISYTVHDEILNEQLMAFLNKINDKITAIQKTTSDEDPVSVDKCKKPEYGKHKTNNKPKVDNYLATASKILTFYSNVIVDDLEEDLIELYEEDDLSYPREDNKPFTEDIVYYEQSTVAEEYKEQFDVRDFFVEEIELNSKSRNEFLHDIKIKDITLLYKNNLVNSSDNILFRKPFNTLTKYEYPFLPIRTNSEYDYDLIFLNYVDFILYYNIHFKKYGLNRIELTKIDMISFFTAYRYAKNTFAFNTYLMFLDNPNYKATSFDRWFVNKYKRNIFNEMSFNLFRSAYRKLIPLDNKIGLRFIFICPFKILNGIRREFPEIFELTKHTYMLIDIILFLYRIDSEELIDTSNNEEEPSHRFLIKQSNDSINDYIDSIKQTDDGSGKFIRTNTDLCDILSAYGDEEFKEARNQAYFCFDVKNENDREDVLEFLEDVDNTRKTMISDNIYRENNCKPRYNNNGGYKKSYNKDSDGFKKPYNKDGNSYKKSYNKDNDGFKKPYNKDDNSYKKPYNKDNDGFKKSYNKDNGDVFKKTYNKDNNDGFKKTYNKDNNDASGNTNNKDSDGFKKQYNKGSNKFRTEKSSGFGGFNRFD